MNQQEVEYRRQVLQSVASRNVYSILYVLSHHENAMRTTEIRDAVSMSYGVISATLSRLKELSILDSSPAATEHVGGPEHEWYISLNASPFVQMLFEHVLFRDNEYLDHLLMVLTSKSEIVESSREPGTEVIALEV